MMRLQKWTKAKQQVMTIQLVGALEGEDRKISHRPGCWRTIPHLGMVHQDRCV